MYMGNLYKIFKRDINLITPCKIPPYLHIWRSTTHVGTHTGEKPLGYTYLHIWCSTTHVGTHTGEKPWGYYNFLVNEWNF